MERRTLVAQTERDREGGQSTQQTHAHTTNGQSAVMLFLECHTHESPGGGMQEESEREGKGREGRSREGRRKRKRGHNERDGRKATACLRVAQPRVHSAGRISVSVCGRTARKKGSCFSFSFIIIIIILPSQHSILPSVCTSPAVPPPRLTDLQLDTGTHRQRY